MLIENRFAGSYYVYEFGKNDTRLIILKDMVTNNHTFNGPTHYIKALVPPKEKWWGRQEKEVLIEVSKFNRKSIRISKEKWFINDKFYEHDWETEPPDVDKHSTGIIIKCKVCGISREEFMKGNSLSCDERVVKNIIE